MALSLSQRVQLVVKWLAAERNVNQRDIGVMLGWSSAPAFSQMLNGKKEVPYGLPAKIASLDPRINLHFLDGTSDDMLLDGNDKPVIEQFVPQPRNTGVFIPPELTDMVTDLTATIREQQGIIREQQGMIKAFVDAWVKKGD